MKIKFKTVRKIAGAITGIIGIAIIFRIEGAGLATAILLLMTSHNLEKH